MLLRQRVQHIEVKVVHMEDDGNCQFRSLAHELFGDQARHASVRRTVINHLRAHAQSYSFFVGEEVDWQRYLRRMATPRTWGDELTLRAAADCFGVVVHVVTTEHENWLLNYVPEGLRMEGGDGGTPPQGTRECFLVSIRTPLVWGFVVSHCMALHCIGVVCGRLQANEVLACADVGATLAMSAGLRLPNPLQRGRAAGLSADC